MPAAEHTGGHNKYFTASPSRLLFFPAFSPPPLTYVPLSLVPWPTSLWRFAVPIRDAITASVRCCLRCVKVSISVTKSLWLQACQLLPALMLLLWLSVITKSSIQQLGFVDRIRFLVLCFPIYISSFYFKKKKKRLRHGPWLKMNFCYQKMPNLCVFYLRMQCFCHRQKLKFSIKY